MCRPRVLHVLFICFSRGKSYVAHLLLPKARENQLFEMVGIFRGRGQNWPKERNFFRPIPGQSQCSVSLPTPTANIFMNESSNKHMAKLLATCSSFQSATTVNFCEWKAPDNVRWWSKRNRYQNPPHFSCQQTHTLRFFHKFSKLFSKTFSRHLDFVRRWFVLQFLFYNFFCKIFKNN